VGEEDFAALYRRHRSALVWYLRCHGADDAEAADAVQDAFACALRAGDLVRDPGAWPGWLAGLADVRERADLPFARVPARRLGGGPGPRSAAVALECEWLEEFIAVLGCVLLDGPLSELVGSEIQRAGSILLRLCDEIGCGSASPTRAGAAVADAGDALGEADLVLRVERGMSLDDVIPGVGLAESEQDMKLDAATWLRRLSGEVAAALSAQTADDPAAEASHRRPVPVRRSRGGQWRGRPAGGC
jgi:Sigma-70 region 2